MISLTVATRTGSMLLFTVKVGFKHFVTLSATAKSIRSNWTTVELSIRLKCGNTVDSNTQSILNEEPQHWTNVSERLIDNIQLLAQQMPSSQSKN